MCIYIYTHKFTYTHTCKTDSKFEIIIYCSEKGGAIHNVGVNKRMLVSSRKISKTNGRGFSDAIFRIAVERCILCSTMVTSRNSLRVILSLQVRSILESDPILGLLRGLQYPYYRGANQADVCSYTNFRSIWE